MKPKKLTKREREIIAMRRKELKVGDVLVIGKGTEYETKVVIVDEPKRGTRHSERRKCGQRKTKT